MNIAKLFGDNTHIIELKNRFDENKQDIRNMLEIQKEINNSDKKTIRINGTECEYISPTCLMILSSSRLIAKQKNKDIKIAINSKSTFAENLKKYGFISVEKRNEDNIPLNIVNKEEDAEKIIEKLVEISPLNKIEKDKRDVLKSKLYEIVINALTHSKSELGALYCGYYTSKSEFYFSIYDMGIGIPESVRNYKKDNTMTSKETLKWALQKGNTTLPYDYPRGLGFTLLEEFREKCDGKILLITDDLIYEAKKEYKQMRNLDKKILGTLFTLKISV